MLLKELVSTVKGATGAVVVAADGEAVQWYSVNNSNERLRLRGAYVAVAMHALRGSAFRTGLGSLMNLVVEYDGANLVAQVIDDECLIVLDLEPDTNIGLAIRCARKSRDIFHHEINA